jgi:hypothetical protein
MSYSVSGAVRSLQGAVCCALYLCTGLRSLKTLNLSTQRLDGALKSSTALTHTLQRWTGMSCVWIWGIGVEMLCVKPIVPVLA